MAKGDGRATRFHGSQGGSIPSPVASTPSLQGLLQG